MNLKKASTFLAILMIASLTSLSAQDLIARQAPVNTKLKAIDELALKNQIKKENVNSDGFGLYSSWDNNHVHGHNNTAVPEHFNIDLRGFSMPTTSRKITSLFGPRWGRRHNGLDVKVNIGDTIYAAFEGKVRVVKYEAAGYGNYVVIRHSNGLETIYGHLSKWLVEPNEEVASGQPIGLGGNTGRSTGSHLHFETRFLGQALNPQLLFDFPNQDVTGDFYAYRSGVSRNLPNEEVAESRDTRGNEMAESNPYHKVQKGETLYRIAKENGISVDKLCQLNGLKKSTKLRPGQILRCS